MRADRSTPDGCGSRRTDRRDDLFIAYPLWLTENKGARLRELSERTALRLAVDSGAGAESMAHALGDARDAVEVLVEVDSGQHRTGCDPAQAGSVASRALSVGLRVVGVFTFPGHGYRPGHREETAHQESAALSTAADALTSVGVDPVVRSGGSTPTVEFADAGVLTEVRPGVYPFNDAQQVALGRAGITDVSLAVMATVVHREPGRFVLDCGSKILGTERPDWVSGFGLLLDHPDSRVVALSEHHATVVSDAPVPELGSVLRVAPNHVCITVNLVDELVVTSDRSPHGAVVGDGAGRQHLIGPTVMMPIPGVPSRRRLGVSVGIASVLLFSGCATDPVPPTTAQLSKAPSVTFQQIGVDEVRAGTAEVVTATRQLGVALAQTGSEGAANRVVSPWSAMTALAMVRAGAGGTTAAEMDRALGPYQPKALAALIGQLGLIGGDPGTVDENNPPTPPVYRQGTGLFAQKSLPLGKQYLTELSRRFDTGVYPIDFRTPQAAEAINEWVTVNTGGQIRQAPLPPAPDTVLSLLSTVYLGAAWDRPFTQTIEDGTFTTAPGRTVTTAMMSLTDDFGLARGSGWTALELPYGGGGLAMQVVLPNEGTSVNSMLADTTLAAVSEGLKRARPVEVSVTLPRWKTEQSVDLGSVLERLGVQQLFGPDADLTAISKNASVSEAAQSATITVGEKGTIAAAVTQIPMMITGLPGAPPETFDADRPFVYQIVDTSTSLPLFLGVVANPSTN